MTSTPSWDSFEKGIAVKKGREGKGYRMTDAIAQQIVHELYPSSWNDFIVRCPIEDLQAMAKFWLLRKRIIKGISILAHDQKQVAFEILLAEIEEIEGNLERLEKEGSDGGHS